MRNAYHLVDWTATPHSGSPEGVQASQPCFFARNPLGSQLLKDEQRQSPHKEEVAVNELVKHRTLTQESVFCVPCETQSTFFLFLFFD